MTDRLTEIKDCFDRRPYEYMPKWQREYLIGEVERLRVALAAAENRAGHVDKIRAIADKALDENDGLRGALTGLYDATTPALNVTMNAADAWALIQAYEAAAGVLNQGATESELPGVKDGDT